jgi:signal peptidase II
LSHRHIERTTRNALIFILTAAAVILVDQVAKLIIVAYTVPGRAISVIPHVLVLRQTSNTGAAFGIMSGRNSVVFLIAAVIIALTIVWFFVFRKRRSPWTFVGLGLILGGALGNNLIDRLARHRVIDFFDLGWWPVFNIADIAIVAGVIIVIAVSAVEIWREDAAHNPQHGGA